MNRNWFLFAIFISLGSLMIYGLANRQVGDNSVQISQNVNNNEEYLISKIAVLQGHEFDIVLIDGRRILARLAIRTPPEAKHIVVAHINKCRKPKCVVLDRNSEFWMVDLLFEESANPAHSLTEWLRQQNLVWE